MKEQKQCEAVIKFANDITNEAGIMFRCELEAGHRGKHQCSGLSETSKFVLTWETFAIVDNYIPSLRLGVA